MEEISGYEAKGETDEDGNVVIKLTLKEGEPEKPEEPKDLSLIHISIYRNNMW